VQVSDNINMFVSTAEGFVRDLPPEQVAVPSVSELSRDAFVAGVTGTLFVREHIKLNLLHPARLEEDDAEAQVCCEMVVGCHMRWCSTAVCRARSTGVADVRSTG
jgi:hypothetical protein